MIVEKCDSCKKQSPDAKDLYIGNHWIEIRVRHRDKWGNAYRYILLCDDCFEKLPLPAGEIRND